MRIIIPSVQTPFIEGGASIMTEELKKALIKEGLDTRIVSVPFKFFPDSEVKKSMDIWKAQDFTSINGIKIDKIISLQFPTYYLTHPDKILWLMHQHRAVYDLYDENKKESEELKRYIHQSDTEYISKIKKRFSISKTVANRLRLFNSISSKPLYHPPKNEDIFYCEEWMGYIFYPSRLSALKRQDLLIKALLYTKYPIKAIIAGEGSFKKHYENLIKKLNLESRVKLIGYITEKEKAAFYANSLAVSFIPKDEDYGYITLEAMLSSKPIITCNDSGAVLEFVKEGETGFVTNPDPKSIAQILDMLYKNRQKAKTIGKRGREFYESLNLSWRRVVEKLLED